MNFRICIAALILASSMALPGLATAPPMPPLTNGDGNVAHNGMKHANITLEDTALSIHIDDPPPAPVTMISGHGADYTPAKFDVLEDVHFNAQYGWLPGGIFSPPSETSIWIKRTAATQPAGSIFKVYEGGNMTEGMAAWTMNEIYTHDDFIWQWDGAMQHDYFVGDRVGDYSMSFEVYIGDSSGNALPSYSSASTTFSFQVVPEPSTWVLATWGIVVFILRRR